MMYCEYLTTSINTTTQVIVYRELFIGLDLGLSRKDRDGQAFYMACFYRRNPFFCIHGMEDKKSGCGQPLKRSKTGGQWHWIGESLGYQHIVDIVMYVVHFYWNKN